MGTELFQPQIWFHSHKLTGDMTSAALSHSVEVLDRTTIADGTRIHKGGLKIVSFESEGFFQADETPDLVDPLLFANLNSVKPLTFGPTGSGVDGQVGYTFAALENVYNPIQGAVGEMLKINLSCAGAGDLVRGTIMLNSTGLGSTGNGTARQLGAVTASQKVFASLHVTSAAGSSPTLDVTIDSAADEPMTVATTQITFTQAVAVTSEGPLTANGAITDDWWRVEYTITGGSPLFDAVILIGIQ